MDEVFGALNDPSRRLLLDRLFEADGQTLGELCEHLPGMTRFGVMNHLRVLDLAGLVVTCKVGRSKHHYLNPVPIRLVHDRWITKYTEPWVGGLAALTAHLEGETMAKPDHVYQTFIRATPQRVWDAITDGDQTVQYFYGTRVESTWEKGAVIRYLGDGGAVIADGEVLDIDPGARLDMTFHARWEPEIDSEGPTRMVWIIGEQDGLTTLTVEYYGLPAGSKRHESFIGGIPYIVAGLKTWVETGVAMG